MGSGISVPLGASVLAYNTNGETQNFGDQLTGDNLQASYVPGSYPYFDTFLESQLFECRGYAPGLTQTFLARGEIKNGTSTVWVRIA
jgi:hypothetical protein